MTCKVRVPRDFQPNAFLPDGEKVRNTMLFERRGGRRQDHGTRGNSYRPYDPYNGSEDADAMMNAGRNAMRGNGSFENCERAGTLRMIFHNSISPNSSVEY